MRCGVSCAKAQVGADVGAEPRAPRRSLSRTTSGGWFDAWNVTCGPSFWISNWRQTSEPLDVTVLRFQSLTVPIPFRRGASKRRRATPRSFLRKGCRFDAECEACFGSIKALATHVLRYHRQMETVSRLVVTNQCPACRAVYGSSLAVINSSWVLS